MKNEIYLKAGRVELSLEEVREFVNAGRVYIVAYRDIYLLIGAIIWDAITRERFTLNTQICH